jgi:hypothetical protein
VREFRERQRSIRRGIYPEYPGLEAETIEDD